MQVEVIISDVRSEIDLEGQELLKLEFGQPGTRVLCTTGTLWLTQAGDPHDHILKTGQAFTLDQPGTILVQGLPCGKAVLLEFAQEPLYNRKSNCSNQLEHSGI
jgi:hypothetical protein